MNTIKETFYVVYKEHAELIPDFTNGRNILVPAGYYFAPYPLHTDKISFHGSMWNCGMVMKGLQSFSLN